MVTSKTRRTKQALYTLSKRHRSVDSIANIYGEGLVREWYQLRWCGWDYDLDPERLGEPPDWKLASQEIERVNEGKAEADLVPYPEQPKWWPWWMEDNDGLDSMLNLSWSAGRTFSHGREWREPWRWWALTNGIAPGQVFCVEIGEPEVSKGGYEVVEYDIYWDAFVVDVIPMPAKVVLQRWEHDYRRTDVARAQHVALAAANADALNRDVGSMYIKQMLYSTGASYEVPKGRSYSLRSKKNLTPCSKSSIGVEGRSDSGDSKEAMAQLVESACKHNPYLSPKLLAEMRVEL